MRLRVKSEAASSLCPQATKVWLRSVVAASAVMMTMIVGRAGRHRRRVAAAVMTATVIVTCVMAGWVVTAVAIDGRTGHVSITGETV